MQRGSKIGIGQKREKYELFDSFARCRFLLPPALAIKPEFKFAGYAIPQTMRLLVNRLDWRGESVKSSPHPTTQSRLDMRFPLWFGARSGRGAFVSGARDVGVS